MTTKLDTVAWIFQFLQLVLLVPWVIDVSMQASDTNLSKDTPNPTSVPIPDCPNYGINPDSCSRSEAGKSVISAVVCGGIGIFISIMMVWGASCVCSHNRDDTRLPTTARPATNEGGDTTQDGVMLMPLPGVPPEPPTRAAELEERLKQARLQARGKRDHLVLNAVVFVLVAYATRAATAAVILPGAPAYSDAAVGRPTNLFNGMVIPSLLLNIALIVIHAIQLSNCLDTFAMPVVCCKSLPASTGASQAPGAPAPSLYESSE